MDADDREDLWDHHIDPEDPLFRDRQGQPISLREYSRLRSEHSYRFLARDTVADRIVATAWLGADQGPFADDPRPLIFGTVALDPDGTLFEDHETFAATEDEARANHAALLARLRADQPR